MAMAMLLLPMAMAIAMRPLAMPMPMTMAMLMLPMSVRGRKMLRGHLRGREASEDARVCGPSKALEAKLGGKRAEASKAWNGATCGSVGSMGAMMRMRARRGACDCCCRHC
jgi:hypothetical protein